MENLVVFLTLIYLFINYSEQASVVCDLPKLVGPCKSALQRYYYDNNVNKCTKFTYGGCGGNSNNFNSLEECQGTCSTQTVPLQADICSLPKVIGPCKASKRRYYFNAQTRKCDQFIYGGCRGNDNNFNKIEDCQNRCEEQGQVPSNNDNICLLPKVIGPCKARIRRYYFNGQTRKCELFTYGGCQGNDNNFNNIADCQNRCENQEQSLNIQDICQLPQESGMCLAYFPRYYYNSTDGQCKNFIYGGCGGNANNFNSLEECQSSCSSQRTENVLCSLGEPLMEAFSSFPKSCSRQDLSSCPEDYSCNTTHFNSPGVCCPTQYMPPPPEFNPCNQGSPLKDTRTGKQVFCKYPEMTCPNSYKCIYDIADAPAVCCPLENQFFTSPSPILFSPCLNGAPLVNFRTGQQQRCSRTGSCPNGYECFTNPRDRQNVCCPVTSVTDISIFNPCQYGEPLHDFRTGQEQRCGFQIGACPNGYDCFTEIPDRPAVCCPKPTNVEPTDICSLPKKEGPCYAAFTRYFYNSERRQCEQFTFGGCQPNANNFGTLQECQRKCFQTSDVVPFNPCQQGEPLLDPRTGEQKMCGFLTGSCPQGYQCFTEIPDRPAICCPISSSTQLRDICKLPKQVGSCFASFNRYFYNSQQQQCEQFIYGGCQGNANNFMTLQECKTKCNIQGTDVATFNSCQYGEPFIDFRTGHEQRCGFKTGTCPAGYHCFTAIDDRPAICCPADSSPNLTDICSLPKKIGPCKAAFRRFYFNFDKKQCEQFIFGGCQENSNNFVSLNECQQKCNSQGTEVVPFSPCENGEPLRDNRTNQERRCALNRRCPNGYRCIPNTSDHSSVCCPST